MSRFGYGRGGVALWLAVLMLAAVAAWASAAEQVPAAKGPIGKVPLPQAAAAGDAFTVPQGGPDELFQFIERLKSVPPGLTPEASQQYANKANRAIVKAAEKILTLKPNEQQAETAVETRMWGLYLLEQSGDAEAGKQLASFPAELQKGGRAKLARLVRGFLLESRFQEGMPTSAAAVEKDIAEVTKYLSEAPLEEHDVELMMAAARAAEMAGKTDLAVNTYKSFGKMLAASREPRIAGMAKVLEGVARRLTLVGNTMKVEGTRLDGGTLDWKKYAGKVVLVDFWATWCGPCIAELPNVLQAYELYHSRGLEVIGISCDQSREDLQRFLQANPLPWPVLFSDNGNNATAEYYGVMAIPTMILVGANGKVVSIDAHGPQLQQELEKIFAQPLPQTTKQSGKPQAKPADPKQPPTLRMVPGK